MALAFIFILFYITSSFDQAQNSIYYVGPNNQTTIPVESIYYPYYDLNFLIETLISSSNQNITLFLQESTIGYNLSTNVYLVNKNVTIQLKKQNTVYIFNH